MSETPASASNAPKSPALGKDPCQGPGKRRYWLFARRPVGTTPEQMRGMHAVVRGLSLDPAQEAFWTSRWETYLDLAATRVESNREWFYRLRAVAVISSVIVPSLVGLNLSGTGGEWVRWITFVLSLVAALSTATLTLFRFGDRWFLYRDLQNDLLVCGWAYVEAIRRGDQTWHTFVAATNTAIHKYNGSYETELNARHDGQDDAGTKEEAPISAKAQPD